MAKKKTALVTGIRGQDGAYLAKLLLEKDYIVYGADRRSGSSSYWRTDELGITDKINFVYMELTEFHNVCNIIKNLQPDEIYNLGAMSFVQASFAQPFLTTAVNAIGQLNILEAVREYSFHSKVYFAGTCLPAGTKITVKKKYKRVRNGKEQDMEQLSSVNIEDLKVGDDVLSMDMTTSKKENCKIVWTSDRIAEDMYELYFDNNNYLRLSGNHPVYVVNKGWVRADELKEGDETIHKTCASLNNIKRRGKSNTDLYGEVKAQEIKSKSSLAQKNCNHPGNGWKGKSISEIYDAEKVADIKNKMRKSHEGSVSWNTGLTKETHKSLQIASEKNKVIQKKLWKNREHAHKVLVSQNKPENKSEINFFNFLETFVPGEFLSNGLAEYICIDGKVPDFINVEKKKIIEYNGERWHTEEEAKERVQFFKEQGWETLIVWHRDFLNFPEKVEKEIKTYMFNPDVEISKITKIKKAPPEKVYDIEVEKNHNFFANCILVHNSEQFGKVQEVPQKETTPFYPRSPYGVAKQFGFDMTRNYRESYGMFCCSGLLFNHESPLRGSEFVTRKITKSIAKMYKAITNKEKIETLSLGNIYAKRDWSHAADMVEGMWKMLQYPVPNDFVLGSGKTYTIKDFVNMAWAVVSSKPLEWFNENEGIKEYAVDSNDNIILKISPDFFRHCEVDLLLADPTNAKEILNWNPQYNITTLVKEMVDKDVERIMK